MFKKLLFSRPAHPLHHLRQRTAPVGHGILHLHGELSETLPIPFRHKQGIISKPPFPVNSVSMCPSTEPKNSASTASSRAKPSHSGSARQACLRAHSGLPQFFQHTAVVPLMIAFLSPKEEDQTPGRLPRTSTSSPESSARTMPGMHLEAETALSVAFSVNVTPVSSTGGAWG